MYDIFKRFEQRYGFLKKMGITFEGIQMIDPVRKKQAIMLTRPFIFDTRLLPKRYDGIDIKARIQGKLPEEFKLKDANDYIFAPEKFEKYVDNNLQKLREAFEKPEMTKLEILDALAFGSFEEHKKNTEKLLREKQRAKYLASRKRTAAY